MPETNLIDQAIQALETGEQERAQRLLSQHLAANPREDRAWVLLSTSLSDIDKKRYCLERALSIQPENLQARQALDALTGSEATSITDVEPAPDETTPTTTPTTDQPTDEQETQAPAGWIDNPPIETVEEPVKAATDATPGAIESLASKKPFSFSRAQTCLVVLLAILMLAAVAALALIVFKNQGIGPPVGFSQPGQAPAIEAPQTFFQFPATWTPAPTIPLTSMGPTAALTPTPAAFQTSLPSLTPVAPDRLIVIGRSSKNQPIEVYRFGNGPHRRMIIAGIHGGDEGNTIALADQLIAHLRRNRQIVPPGYTLYILRSLNPDGEKLGNIPEGRLNANGVDLNRNFDVGWKATWRSDGCSSGPGTAGSGPGSEPETQALKNFLGTHKIEVLISYHSAYLGIFPSGEPAHAESARLAQAIHDISTYPYPPVRNGCEYTGTLVDWAAENGVLAAVDLELNSEDEAELETNLKVLSLLLSFEPNASQTQTPPAITPTSGTQSPTSTQTGSITPSVTSRVVIAPTP